MQMVQQKIMVNTFMLSSSLEGLVISSCQDAKSTNSMITAVLVKLA